LSVTGTLTATGTGTQTATEPAITSYTAVTTNTLSVTGTYTLTGTATTTSVLQPVPDLDACVSGGNSCDGNPSYCYLNSTITCTSDSTCSNLTSGDFCRRVSTLDGSGRIKGDFCPDPVTGVTTRTCRYQAKSCTADSDCHGGVGDYCSPAAGKPAKMCQKSGLWCTDYDDGCNDAIKDVCVSATSRLMMVKNAVRRVVLDHAYDDTAVVKMGHMHTYQASRSGDITKLFPYVRLATASLRTDVKFLTRSELLKGKDGPCFSETDGPTNCTIAYGGGAVTTPDVVYTLQGGANSRYAVPTGDGKTYVRNDCAWSDCKMQYSFSGVGTGLYEGSYYTFQYMGGQPVSSGSGSVANPVYWDTYQGKSYGSPGNYWTLMEAERSEKVNENKYGANEFTGSTWSRSAEYPLPLVGASSAEPLASSLSASPTCNDTNGAQWDHTVVPRVNAKSFGGNTSLKTTQKALLNVARLEKASYGGFYATGNLEPVSCALKNDGPNDSYHTVDGYMSEVKTTDASANIANGNLAPCWENHVLLVVDGLPRGPGDVAVGGVNCAAKECRYDPNEFINSQPNPDYNPDLNGCVCPAVMKARDLAKAGVNVHVIAATSNLDPRNLYAAGTLNNIARAGSTDPTFINIPRYATSEDELYYWLNYEMKEALRVTVATTPASAASGAQSAAGVTAGNMLYQTTVELPEWRGSLVGFSISSATATRTVTGTGSQTATATVATYSASVKWDAASKNAFTVRPGAPPSADQQQLWKKRNVYFSDATGNVQKIIVGNDDAGTIDPGTADALHSLGLGADAVEAARIVQWMLGKLDPTDNTDHKPLNPAVMGSVVNSMPIDVGPPGASTMPGGNQFWYSHVNRPELVYLGADDGMLHAFYADIGMEAFAFIPADMVPIIARLYAQGGQRYSPNEHVYGLAGSPKVKNLCVDRCNVTGPNCVEDPTGLHYDNDICPVWKTILVMGEGPGGNHPFALDITDPVQSGSPVLDNSTLLWHVGYKPKTSGISSYTFGETTSVPAFAYHQTAAKNDYRVLIAAGDSAGSNTTLIDATALTGATPVATVISGSGSCSSSGTGQEFAVVADVAVARDYSKGGDQNLLAAYVGDTWGRLHQYAPGYSPVLDKNGPPLSLGCGHPLHFSPAVVQLDRNNPNNENGNSVFLAQVTNSILDPLTVDYSADKFPGSMLVIAKLSSIGNNPPALDNAFGTGGSIQLTAGATGTYGLCGVTTTGKTSAASDCGAGGSWLPASARPTGTPTAILRSDGSGFQVLTTWYTPPTADWDNCVDHPTNGNSYITLHEFLAVGTWAQLLGFEIQHQYVTGVQFVGTTAFITSGDGSAPSAPSGGTGDLGQAFVSVDQVLKSLAGDRFVKTAWTERLDAD
jgi:hypothetical protein